VGPGDIIEYNSMVLAAQINAWGGDAFRWSIVPDSYEQICSKVVEAAQSADLILLVAGSSAGSEDFSARVVESIGRLMVHGVAIRPGHPVIIGMVGTKGTLDGGPITSANGFGKSSDYNHLDYVPIIGVPGYPVSAALTGEIFVEPLIAKWLGRQSDEPIEMKATLTRKMTSPSGDDDYTRMVVGKVGDKVLAAPLSRGAGSISSLVRADGIVIVPRGSQGLPAGEEVSVRLYRSPGEIERTIFAIGSHDISLDVIAQFLSNRNRRLASTNVGSLGGLIALSRGESHMAGSHLLDPESGEYNLSHIQQYLPGKSVLVVSLVKRDQGLMVPSTNPKGIRSLEDLIRQDIYFVNRQRGSGTRVLLDYQMGKLGVEIEDIRGYDQEEFTHLGVAAGVASGRCDCGLGIAAAAVGLGLDFIPLFQERYDLIIPKEFAEGGLLEPLFEILHDNKFKQVVASMPGYETSIMGKIITDIE
jgi:putative molybdopterin biosynthesis protein